MKFEGVIFDLDGTLVNSLEDIADSMNSVLMDFNYPAHEVESYKSFIGKGIQNLVRVSLPESNRDEITVTKCSNLMMETYKKNCLNKTKLYDGIIDLLNQLKSRNMKLGVFSNKADELTKKIVQELMPNYFDIVMGLSTEAHKKPNPVGALHISEKLNIPPENMLYIGDTDIDMQTANNSGMYGIGVLWGFRTKEELIASGAKYVLNYPMDLLDIL